MFLSHHKQSVDDKMPATCRRHLLTSHNHLINTHLDTRRNNHVSSKPIQASQAHHNKSKTISQALRSKTTILNSIVLFILLASWYRPTSGQYDQPTITLDSPSQLPVAQQQPPQALTNNDQQQEVFIQPNSRVQIECKLPPTVNSEPKIMWMYARNSHPENKHEVLCFRRECMNFADKHGIQLKADLSSGTYDILINNATYELNDGTYYCQEQDIVYRRARLTVLIPPQPPSITAPLGNSAPAREGQEYQLNCVTRGGNPEPNITWFRYDQALVPSAGLRIAQVHANESTTSTLTWIPSLEDHQATYKCSVHNKAMQGLAPYEAEETVSVEFAPRISVGPHNPLRVLQGDKATISCQVEANPPVKSIRWFVDGRQISNQYNHTLHDVKISDSGVYSCQANNGIAPLLALAQQTSTGSHASGIGSGLFSFFGISSGSSSSSSQDAGGPSSSIKTTVEARLQLEVLYPPRVQVRQSRQMPLSEGDYFSLNCSADSWPPAHEFIWSKQEDSTTQRRIMASSSPLLEFNSISSSDMGNYTCTAVNRLEPSGINYYQSSQAQQQQQQHSLAMDRQASASSLVLVKHKPGFAEILVGQNGETELGNKTQIVCRIKPPGYPEPTYRFWKYNPANPINKLHLKQQTHDSVYTVFSAKIDDEAKYGCSASNELGPSTEADGELVVNEVPKIIPDSARRPDDTRQVGDSPYSITFRATGKPEPKVVWYHRSPIDGRRIVLSTPEMMMKFRIDTVSHKDAPNRGSRYTVTSTLIFKQALQLDDRGQYTVEFINGLSRSAVEDFQLHIFHTPFPAPRNQPVQIRKDPQSGQIIEPRLKAGFNLDEVASLTCRVSAWPKPEFVWFSGKEEGGAIPEQNSRYRFELNNTQDDVWESTMSFSMTSEADYSNYMCASANRDSGKDQMSDTVRQHIILSRKSLPDAPNQLEQIDASQDSITLQWIPGFDGGFQQNQYFVQYTSESDTSIERRATIDQQQDMLASASINNNLNGSPQDQAIDQPDQQQQQQYVKIFDCGNMNPCIIGNLAPESTYAMRVRARNELGYGEFSVPIKAVTRANISHVPKIIDGSFDKASNKLTFRVEPNVPEYLLKDLSVKIEVKSYAGASTAASINANSINYDAGSTAGLTSTSDSSGGEWRFYLTMLIEQERSEVLMTMPQSSEQLRLTLCSRSNESLCGEEFYVYSKSLASSFLQDQRGLSLSILMLAVILVAVLGAFATTAHSCCASRKAKKAAALDRADTLNGHHNHNSSSHQHHNSNNADNKPLGGHTNGGLSLSGANVNGLKTSNGNINSNLNTGSQSLSANGQLQSMDSIHGLHSSCNNNNNINGSASDHSSDHSRQAKLDSMLPPNYNHYADRASLMLEQQQQQQQQQQAAYLQGKLGSPFGLPVGSLINGQQQMQQASPMTLATNGLSQFSYLAQEQPNPMMDEHNNGAISLHSVLDQQAPNGQMVDGQQQPQTALWPTHHPSLDDYNNYNTLTSYQQQQQQQDQMVDPTYGTTASLIMAQQQSSYDNNAAANSQFSPYLAAPVGYQQQQHQADSSQYQQEIAAAQQQMYGTLNRNSYQQQQTSSNGSAELQSINHHHQQQGLIADQQQLNEQYMATNGLVQPPPPPPVESDYGTTRGGRLIREIIV